MKIKAFDLLTILFLIKLTLDGHLTWSAVFFIPLAYFIIDFVGDVIGDAIDEVVSDILRKYL